MQKKVAISVFGTRITRVDEWNIPEGSNRPMRKVTLAVPVSNCDSNKGLIVDPPYIKTPRKNTLCLCWR